MNILKLFSFMFISALLAGCAGHFPVPGGSDTVNKSYYESEDDLKDRIQALQVGMTKEQVFAALNRKEEHFTLLNRSQISTALYGNNSQSQYIQPYYNYASYGYGNENENGYRNNYGGGLQSFTGYNLLFQNIEREHGISSPIAMRTDKVGFSYSATFIFQNNRLYEKPILSGGAVETRSTKTIFDYLSPESVMGYIPI